MLLTAAPASLASPPRAAGRAQRRRCCASASTSESSTRPEWAGDALLSQLVNAAINSPLYGLMKPLARQTLINTAESNGVAWRDAVRDFEADDRLQELLARYTDASVAGRYPAYYTLPFHAYETGNLNWLCAHEAESATYSMAMRIWPTEVKSGALSWQAAQQRLRDSYTGAIAAFLQAHGGRAVNHILDVGCSVGISTRALGAAFPSASTVTGLDLSPYMLAVAAARDATPAEPAQPAARAGQTRRWVHGFAEETKLESSSVDLFSAAFLFHELPQAPSRAVMAEAYRVLRPGGVFALTDNNPQSEVIKNLPPLLFTLMKSTEPHSDEYYVFDVEAELRKTGFAVVQTVETDPRHRTVLAMKR